ncbi:RNA polymerase sigma factor [Marinicella sp. W31]|uniref:RNA polymerase sigma factor n=1 Tax=Marinicella sp. W31 TaxID=3023713 RepID=UPI0037566ED9
MTQQHDFEQLMALYYGNLQRLAASYEVNLSLREELLQDILECIWKSLKNFRGEASIKTYIFQIAHFRGARHVQQQMRRVDTYHNDSIEPIDPDNPQQQAEQQQQIDKLIIAMQQLPIIQRQLISLFLDGFSYQEMATITGLKSNHIGVSLNRAKTALKSHMEQYYA